MLKKWVPDDHIYILQNPAEYIWDEKLELAHV